MSKAREIIEAIDAIDLSEAKIAVASQALAVISNVMVQLGQLLEPGTVDGTVPAGLLGGAPPAIQNAARKSVEELKKLADLVTDTIGQKVAGEVTLPPPPVPGPPPEKDFEEPSAQVGAQAAPPA